MSYQQQGFGYGYGQAQGQSNGPPSQQPQQQAYGYGGQPHQRVGELTQQVGQMGIDQLRVGSPAPRRKKDRHAYHQLEQPAASTQSFNGAPPGQYTNGQTTTSPQPTAQPPAAPWQSQPTTPSIPQQPQTPTGAPIRMDASQPQQSRVHPDHIPSVPSSRDLPAKYYQTTLYPTLTHRLPPPSLTPFIVRDEGNASPKHARLTMTTIPSTAEQLATTSLPLGLTLQPLAHPHEHDTPIPLLDFGDTGPPRCRRCRAYVNPSMLFTHGGNRMVCNLCGHVNEVAPEYFAPTDPNGVRVDVATRPELALGTCEFVVPREYWVHMPRRQRTVFVIDVSAEACARGYLRAVCDGVAKALYGDDLSVEDEVEEDGEDAEDDGEERKRSTTKVPKGMQVGFVTFDRDIQFYNVSKGVARPQQLVMPDLSEPFAAISSDFLFVDPAECKANILVLLQQLPGMFESIRHAEPALFPALQSALAALGDSGGKIVCSLGSLSTYGPAALTMRDKGALNGANDMPDYEKVLFRTDSQPYKRLQADMIKAGVGIDLFLTAPTGGYLDIATVGYLAEKTGGESYYYPNWSWPRDTLKLEKELSHSIRREQGYAALMKVRCSNGLQIANYYGNFTQHTFGADLEMGSISEDTSVAVTFSYDGKLDQKLNAHFQSALLYTSVSGQRIVRCTNVVATVTESARDSMRFIDQDAVLTILAKDSATRIPESRSLHETRNYLQEKTTDILSSYRKHHAGPHPPGQLVMPENLKEFAMYVLGLIKSRALRAGKEPSDRRVHELRLVRGLAPAELSLYLYPRILPLHSLEPEEGFADETTGQLKLPRAVRASFPYLDDGGAYLVDNGQQVILWFHAQVSPNLLEDLFGPEYDALEKLDPQLNQLPVLDTHLNAQVRNILFAMETDPGRGSKGLSLQLSRQGLDGSEFEFARLLYEDRNGEASSYVDWLVLLHRGIGSEMNGQKSKAATSGESSITNTITNIANNVPYWGQK